ncbi:hypothetical protein LCGC14_1049860 [marine sediment metagenome]|uniref:Uncharacterized protein n=1 Tax=marine sediment metagenome TaxID=412755 RepID=A0A0F9NB19_9ZZZZ
MNWTEQKEQRQREIDDILKNGVCKDFLVWAKKRQAEEEQLKKKDLHKLV